MNDKVRTGDLVSKEYLLNAFSHNSIFSKITNAEGKNVLEIIEDAPTTLNLRDLMASFECAEMTEQKLVEQYRKQSNPYLENISSVMLKTIKMCKTLIVNEVQKYHPDL